MKWHARVKRAKKREVEEARAWESRDVEGVPEDLSTSRKTTTKQMTTTTTTTTTTTAKRARAVVNPLAVDDALVASRRREGKTKGKRRKRTSYAADKVEPRRSAANARAEASVSTQTPRAVDVGPRYASGNPFAALANARLSSSSRAS
jgi:hypothetical protein